MRRPRLAVVNAAIEGADTRRNVRREFDADLVEIDATAGASAFPDDLDVDGVVVTGSRSSVYDDAPWIDATREWVGAAIDDGVPCLGICWGHQLLASIRGGDVADMGEYEIGYRTVERTPAGGDDPADDGVDDQLLDHVDDQLPDGVDDPLLDGVDDAFTVFTTHSDVVTDLPPGAVELARNEYGTHAFRDDHVFGVQFHPEYDRDSARRVTEGKDDLAADRKQEVIDGITTENYAAACEAKRVFENFTAYVDRQRAANPPAR
jgi:GMP synthase (glutamine-hydrolysing)